jgi:hypothetical protein
MVVDVRIFLNCEVSIIGAEESVPGSSLTHVLILLVSEALIVSFVGFSLIELH